MTAIYLVVGVPGSGKSWVCEQLKDHFTYVRHDDYMGHTKTYAHVIAQASRESTKPLLIEAPFSVSEITDELAQRGLRVTPVYIVQNDKKLAERYEKRGGKPIPPGHLTRQRTYADRAKNQGAFIGTSDEVLEHLRGLARVATRSA